MVAQLNEQAQKMQNGTDSERSQAFLAMLPELPKLVSKGASFEISTLKMAIPEGHISGNLKISIPESDSKNPFAMLQKLAGEGKLQMPKVIVKKMLLQTIKQKLMAQSALEKAMVMQMQKSGTNDSADNKQINHNAMSDDIINKKAESDTDAKISSLVSTKILVENGDDYLIILKLENGQITVNGQPFRPELLKI